MLHRSLKYLGNNAIALLALFLALGGVGYAASGGFTTGGQLRACVRGNGSLTLLRAGKRCKKGQTAVAWNQLGQQGARGAVGPRGSSGAAGGSGAQGPAGVAGPSDGYLARQSGTTTLPQEKATAIVQLTLPPSTGYIVTGAAELGNNAATAGFVDCTLSDGASTSSGSTLLPGQAAFVQTLTLTGTTDGGVITLSCNPDNAGQARNGVITAVRVGVLHTG
jgi:hypothetical protein